MKSSVKRIIFAGLIFLFLVSISVNAHALLIMKTPASFDGYTLFTPEFSTKVFLIDNNGQKIHCWKTGHVQGLPVYLLEDGNLLRGDAEQFSMDFFLGGVTGHIEMLDWNSTLLWEYSSTGDEYLLHNDIEPLPNGNILMTAWEKISNAEAIDAGCNPGLIGSKDVWSDVIIEVEPVFPSGGAIVWEWHAWDHLIQDFDSSKQNFGVVSAHPERIDINFEGARRDAPDLGIDLFHVNSVEYIKQFDQILLNARNLNEIWIIDHATTTQEAAGSVGGRYGCGGDLLYRWGNPQTYNRGNMSDQQLFMQHDARWVESENNFSITLFNNGYLRPGKDYSEVLTIIPPVNETGFYSLPQDGDYGPVEPVWMYSTPVKKVMYSPFISGAQLLPNGNMFICSGDDGLFLEVTAEKNIVWMYLNLLPLPFINNVFKTQTYPADYPGLKQLHSPE